MSGSGPRTPGRYDVIGLGYRTVRHPEPRIGLQIRSAIGDVTSVVNVGAGSGAYEPHDAVTVAVEPSRVMIAQRDPSTASLVRGAAEGLPFRDLAFDVAMAVHTVHHWDDPLAGLREMRRVSRRQVVLTWDPLFRAQRFWFTRDYLPQALDRERKLAALTTVIEALGGTAQVEPVPLPADCTDGFYGAYWARPEAYLDPSVRAAISVLALADPVQVANAVRRLAADLRSGAWQERNAALLGLASFDAGYRLVIAGEP